jgi:diguanylate cyclase with GGDEF domain/PucR-like helix-turn-helix protein
MNGGERQSRAALLARLQLRRPELEADALARVNAISDPTKVADPEYLEGLRSAVSPALDYAFAAIEHGVEGAPPPPTPLLAQARLAARNGVSLDTVLRRYFAGYTLVGDCLLAEAGESGLVSAHELKRLLRAEAELFDDLVTAISAEYRHEADQRHRGADRRRAELVGKLLAGQPVASSRLNYPLDGWHLAAVASGPGAVGAFRDLAGALDRRLLLVRPGDAVWAWLGGRSKLSARELLRLGDRNLPAEVSIAVGESGEGTPGWRLSHRQAKAAMAVLQQGAERLTRYADVALIAAALRDEVLATSLHEIYLAPLEKEHDGGAALRRTLRAYFKAGRKTSLAAAALGVSRKTVSVRLRSVGKRVGQPVDRCAAELETALRLRGLHR